MIVATDAARMYDTVLDACGYTRGDTDDLGMFGWGFAELFDGDGQQKQWVPFVNLITDVGDIYYANRGTPIQSSTVSLTSNTGANPSVVTAAAAHHFSVGDKVVLAGITGGNYNGEWAITAVGGGTGEDGATTFSINVGTAMAAGTGGTATSAASGKANRMRLGTGSTAVAKNGAGAAIVTYVSAITATKAFDSGYPQRDQVTGGQNTVYKTTWAAGEATQNGLNEVVIAIDNLGGDIAGTAAYTISRALLSPVVNKGASDTLAITWRHKFLGA